MSLIDKINSLIEERIKSVCDHYKIEMEDMAVVLVGERLVWDMDDAFLNANTLEELDEVWKRRSEVLLNSGLVKSDEDRRRIKECYDRRRRFLESGELLEEEYV